MPIMMKKFIGLRVETKSGRYLGRVRDAEIDTDNLEIKQIYVRPAGLVKGLSVGDLIVAKSSILSIDDKKIIVLDLAEKELAREAAPERKIAMDSPAVSAAEMEN